jgi:hypothetical protein
MLADVTAPCVAIGRGQPSRRQRVPMTSSFESEACRKSAPATGDPVAGQMLR